MFREYVKQCRSDQQRVRVELVSGKWIEGVIMNHGPEAVIVCTGPGVERCVLKHAIVSIAPAPKGKKRYGEAE